MTIQSTPLPNGIRVVTDHMATVETASLGAWVAVGTRHEDADINGISHLLEHMAFKGTPRRSAQAIVEDIEAVGGHLNAYTARENTAYYAKVLKQDVALAVDIIADILQHSIMDATELDRERAVIVQEIHQADDTPDDVIFDYFQEAAFPDQPIGRPVLGSAKLIERLPRETILSYMAEEYAGERIVFAAAGNVDHDDLVALVTEAFGGLAVHGGTAAAALEYRGGEYIQPRDLGQVHVVLGFNGVSYDDVDFYPAAVLSTLLGGGMSSRLFQEVREKRGLVYSIYSFTSNYLDGGLFGIYAGTGGDEVTQIFPVICDELKKLTDKIGDGEIARTRAQLKSSILMSLESTSARVEQAARQLQIYNRHVPIDEVIEKIDAVGTAELNGYAARLLASTPTLAAIGPTQHIEGQDKIAQRLR